MKTTTALTPAQSAALESIRDKLLVMLDGDGLSQEWLGELLGVPKTRLTPYLESLGAFRANNNRWRLPNINRLKDFSVASGAAVKTLVPCYTIK